MDKQPNILDISFSKSMELALNSALYLDEDKGRSFQPLEGKVIALRLKPATLPLFCLFSDKQISVQNNLIGEADAAIDTSLIDFIALPATHELPNAKIDGDQALAKQFIGALSQLDIDWEEHLSHYTGDLLAFKIGHGVRSLLQTRRDTKQYVGSTLREYLQFEIEVLPTASQVAHFAEQVKATREAVDSIAQRIAALQAGLNDQAN